MSNNQYELDDALLDHETDEEKANNRKRRKKQLKERNTDTGDKLMKGMFKWVIPPIVAGVVFFIIGLVLGIMILSGDEGGSTGAQVADGGIDNAPTLRQTISDVKDGQIGALQAQLANTESTVEDSQGEVTITRDQVISSADATIKLVDPVITELINLPPDASDAQVTNAVNVLNEHWETSSDIDDTEHIEKLTAVARDHQLASQFETPVETLKLGQAYPTLFGMDRSGQPIYLMMVPFVADGSHYNAFYSVKLSTDRSDVTDIQYLTMSPESSEGEAAQIYDILVQQLNANPDDIEAVSEDIDEDIE